MMKIRLTTFNCENLFGRYRFLDKKSATDTAARRSMNYTNSLQVYEVVALQGRSNKLKPKPIAHTQRVNTAGAIFGAAFILSVAFLYQALRGVEGMGMGDAKLMALIGAFLGIKLTLLVLLLATLTGSLFGILLLLVVWRKRMARRKQRSTEPAPVARARAWNSAKLIFRNFEIPFGVFLGIAAAFAAFLGTPLVHWYLGLY